MVQKRKPFPKKTSASKRPAAKLPVKKTTTAKSTVRLPAKKTSASKRPAAKLPNFTERDAKSVPGSKGSFTAQMRAAGQRVGDIAKPEAKIVKTPDNDIELARNMKSAYGGKNVYVIDLPWEQRAYGISLGATWNSKLRQFIYVGDILPQRLQEYRAGDYSLSRWIEDEINGKIRPVAKGVNKMVPRKHQVEAINKIVNAGIKGWRGFIEADATGVGKTLSALIGISEIAKRRGATKQKPAKLLVMCPKSVIPHWKNTLHSINAEHLRVVVINYDQSKKLLSIPKSAQDAKTTRTKNKRISTQGTPLIRWDFVIADESHKCFTYETLIQTNEGEIPIGEIVEKRLPVLIKTKNNKTGKILFKPIKDYMSNLVAENSIRTITHSYGKINCTSNHPLWVNGIGYKSIEELEQNDKNMFMVSKRIHPLQGAPKTKKLFDELRMEKPKSKNIKTHNLPSMSKRILSKRVHNKILQQKMRLSGKNSKRRTTNVIRNSKFSRAKDMSLLQRRIHNILPESSGTNLLLEKMFGFIQLQKNFSTHEKEQSNVQSRNQSEDDSIQTRNNISLKRWERKINQTAINTTRFNQIRNGAYNSSTNEMVSRSGYKKPAKSLQHRFRRSKNKNFDRGRWAFSSDYTLEILRQEKDSHIRASRVVSSEIYKRNNLRKSTKGGERNIRVYNLEIANNHNYFANDVLVHNCKNHETSQRAKSFAIIARYTEDTKSAPFVVWATATVGQNPLEVGYIAPLIGQVVGKKLTLSNWGKWLEDENYHVKKGKVTYAWTTAAANQAPNVIAQVRKDQKEDVERMSKILFGTKSPSIRRLPESIAGWPQIQRIEFPVELDVANMGLYAQVWTEFRNYLSLHPHGNDPKGGLVQQLRFRQKASMLRTLNTVEFVTDLVDNGFQVPVSVQFIESLDTIKNGLNKRGITTSEFSGRKHINREDERLRFQKGKADVMLFTVTEGISLHAGEQLPDGTFATNKNRATVVHDLRYSSLENLQTEGRSHRDGKKANIYYLFAQNTVEERITKVMLERMANTSKLSGDSDDVISLIEDIIKRGFSA